MMQPELFKCSGASMLTADISLGRRSRGLDKRKEINRSEFADHHSARTLSCKYIGN